MGNGAPLPVREYTSASEMRQHAAEVRSRMFEPQRELIPEALPKPLQAEALRAQDFTAHPPFVLPGSFAQREGRADLRGLECIRLVESISGIPQSALKGRSRKQIVVRARQIAAWLLVNRAGKSFKDAGRFLGGRDHTTMMHACHRVESVELPVGIARDDPAALAAAMWVAYRAIPYTAGR